MAGLPSFIWLRARTLYNRSAQIQTCPLLCPNANPEDASSC